MKRNCWTEILRQTGWASSNRASGVQEAQEVWIERKFPLKGRSCIGNTMLPKNSNHPNHEGAKYRAMLQQFLGSQNRVFCFPPHLNFFQGKLVHVEDEKLGLEHRSCGQGWERFMVVTKAGRTREMLCNSDLSGNCLEYEMEIVKIRKAPTLWPANFSK